MQIVEFDVTAKADPSLLGVPLREAQIPPDSRVAAIIRGDQVVIPRGDETIQAGDRIVVIGSPQAAQAWSELIAPGHAQGHATSSSSAPAAPARRSRASCSSRGSACA